MTYDYAQCSSICRRASAGLRSFGMDAPIPFYAMLGHLGQRVLVLPEENAIIVRLGKQKGLPTPVEGFHLEPDLGQYVSEVKTILDGLVVE